MVHLKSSAIVAVGLLALVGCAKSAQPAADTAADEAAVRAVNPAWFKAYTAGDVDGLEALYADDAVVNVPGAPPARGRAAIRESLAKDIAASTAGGFTLNQGPTSDVGVSGDLGWEWSTFTVTDKSGATVDAGKYVTVYGRKDGKWLIIRDIWNSDTPAAPPTSPSSAKAPAKPQS
jgi:uncharacterized protein (TIGR02246 family)